MDLSFIYVVCLGVGFLFALISAFIGHGFGGHDLHPHAGTGGHAEAGPSAHDMPGFSAISPTTIASFVTAFGGFGLIFSKFELTRNPWVSAPLAALSGFGVAFGVFAMFRGIFSKTQSSSESIVSDLAGAEATIMTPIPQGGVGEIAYVHGGTRYTAPARTETGAGAGSGVVVRITRIVGTQFYVRVL